MRRRPPCLSLIKAGGQALAILKRPTLLVGAQLGSLSSSGESSRLAARQALSRPPPSTRWTEGAPPRPPLATGAGPAASHCRYFRRTRKRPCRAPVVRKSRWGCAQLKRLVDSGPRARRGCCGPGGPKARSPEWPLGQCGGARAVCSVLARVAPPLGGTRPRPPCPGPGDASANLSRRPASVSDS